MKLCKLGALLEPDGRLLRAGDRRYLADQLEAPRIPATALARALTLEGHDTSATTVKDHRGKRCACYRDRTTA